MIYCFYERSQFTQMFSVGVSDLQTLFTARSKLIHALAIQELSWYPFLTQATSAFQNEITRHRAEDSFELVQTVAGRIRFLIHIHFDCYQMN